MFSYLESHLHPLIKHLVIFKYPKDNSSFKRLDSLGLVSKTMKTNKRMNVNDLQTQEHS